MTILVDQDGVLADWGKAWDEALERRGASPAVPRHADQRSFNLKEGLSKEDRKVVDAVMGEPHFYANLEPIEGALDAVREMLSANFDVAIVTSPYYSNPTCIEDKVEWVRRNLGRDWLNRVILAGDKTRVSGTILIDDKPEIHGAQEPNWEHVLFDQPYNRHVTDKRRMLDWGDWRSTINGYWTSGSTIPAEPFPGAFMGVAPR